MVLWEAVLSPALQVLFDKLASGKILEFLSRNKLNALLLEKLKIAYFTNAALLDDAEKKQYNSSAIESWLDMLKNAVYEAEDVLDELATEALRCRLEMNSSQLLTDQVHNLVQHFSPLCESVNSRIETLIEKLEFIAKQKDALGLRSDENQGSGMLQTCPTSPLVNDSHISGRDAEKEDIMKFLVGDNNETNHAMPSVVPVLGMGGIGKTTLAQLIYKDKRVNEAFDVKAWAHVSDDFSLIRVTKLLLESATGKPCDTLNLELLQNGLKEIFHRKKFLVVLDDVWNENLDNWNNLSIPFMNGLPGSKIVVTTRNQEVLPVMNALPPYLLKEMSDEASWSLFEHHVFGVGGSERYPSLRETGRKIVKKCKGLPLAVKTLASVLVSKLDCDHWNEVLASNLWDVPLRKNGVLPSLRLSYHHLPSNLKRCFAYCSIFPKGHEFDRRNLVLLWMAEGFVQSVGDLTPEEVGEVYFFELLSRSFFQESVQDKTQYVMHDLLNDLARSVSRETCFLLEEKWENKQHKNFEKIRHFSCFRSKYDVYRKFESLNEAKWLRTFLPFSPPQGDEFCYLTKKVPCDLLPNLRCLRVLSFTGYCITELPESIGDLKHLRYINLSYTEVKVLPQSLRTLFNLQALLLSNCNCLTELPAEIGRLINLRYLDINGSGIQELPLEIGDLVNLQTLPRFIVGGSGPSFGDMRNLSNAQLTQLPLQVSPQSMVRSSVSGIGELGSLSNAQLTQFPLQVSPHSMVGSSVSGIGELGSLSNAQLTHFPLQVSPQSMVGSSVSGIGELRSLSNASLTHFPLPVSQKSMVGSSVSGIGELRSLSHLRGSLWISRLENVTSSWEARRANLLGKKCLNELVFEWSTYFDEFLDEKPVEVLEMLQPNQRLEKVKIMNYPGKVFPSWIGDPTFSNLVSLALSDCKRCESLPPAGQLPSLKKLYIKGMSRLKRIGVEFYGSGNSSCRPFANLETLSLLEMVEWQQWSTSEDNVEFSTFPALLELHLEKCPKLQGGLPLQLSSLTKLVIQECEQLAFSLPRLPQLHVMEVKGCHHMLLSGALDMTVLTSLEIQNIQNLISLPEGWLPYLRRLELLVISDCSELMHLARNENGLLHLTSLRHLIIRNCMSIDDLQQLPQYVEYLELDSCHSLERLPHSFYKLESLQELVITDCPKLEPFSGTTFPPNLKGLALRGCGLESLPEYVINHVSSLDYLYISGCLVLTSFPRGNKEIPTTFKRLTIDTCPNLEFLPEGMTHSSNVYLQLLEIFDCPSITSFPGGQLPKTLQTLIIWNCSNLVSIVDIVADAMSLNSLRIGNCTKLKHLPSGLDRLVYLDYLELEGCPSIEFFPEQGLPTSLKKMHILNCENLKFVVMRMQSLTSLEELRLSNCPMLAFLPGDSLPINLVSLEIKDCDHIKPCSEWGLHRLAFLKKLSIHGCRLESDAFPEWMLPPTLEALHIIQQPNLKSLSPWLKNLTSLGVLKIEDCHNILALPNEGFPAMVSFLEISRCPLLQRACEEDLSSVDHIPCILM